MVQKILYEDRIINNNNNDPLYPRNKSQSHDQTTITTARQSKNNVKQQLMKRNLNANYKQTSTISKFVG